MAKNNSNDRDADTDTASNEKVRAFSTITVLGSEYRTLITSKYGKRVKWTAPNVKEVKNFIPGTVAKVNVKPGDTVETGDLLVVYEAMKMLNQCRASFSGVIKSVNVKVGDRVPKGMVMVEFE